MKYGKNTTRYNPNPDEYGFFLGYYHGQPFKTDCLAVLIMFHNQANHR